MATSVEEYLRPEVIQQVRRLDLRARFIVEGFYSGLHASPFHGFSIEFSEHRKYTPGDDVRMIDWSVYAKTDRFYVKKYEAETNLQAHLLVDCSRSMGYATGGRMTKMDYAICLGAALGYMMVNQQDAVGLVTFDSAVRTFLPAKSKRAHLLELLGQLARVRPAGPTDVAAALHEAAGRIDKRGLVIVLSDLLSDQQGVLDGLHHLAYEGHDVILFQVFDNAELHFDFDGPVRFREPETGEELTTDPRAIRAAYLREIEAFIETYRRACRKLRADLVVVDNAMTFDRALVKFLAQRQRRA